MVDDRAGGRREPAAQLLHWLRSHGQVGRVGVEGTGTYGPALARHLTAQGIVVIEVNRPNRQVRRRHRLNRGGHRQANAALWRIVIVRLNSDQRSKNYVARPISQGRTKTEAIRCLQRYIAREVFRALPQPAVG